MDFIKLTEQQIIAKAAAVIPSLLSTWIIPKIEQINADMISDVSEKMELLHHDLYKNRFEDYLSNRYIKFFTLDTLVFPNYQTLFDVLYEPLSIREAGKGDEDDLIKIENFPEEIFDKYYRILIKDSAGMGKSTITRKIFLQIIRENQGIPILIELRKLSEKNTMINEIINQLNSTTEKCEENFICKLIERGDFIFLLDGFDEIALADRETVITDIHNFIDNANNCKFLLTSRPEMSLASLGDFKEFNIVPLKQKEAFNLFKRYDRYSYKTIANKLIDVIKNNQFENIKEFLTNPFLASLVFKTFDFKKDIPSQKEQFYRQVYDALFENHDLTKEGYYRRDKYSGLHIDDFEVVTRAIGYSTMKLGKVEYSKNEILDIISKANRFCVGVNFKSSDFLKDLINTVPLLKKEGLSYKWVHKSFQDYFAARFIYLDSNDKKEPILLKLFNRRENDNVLDLYASIDKKGFRHIIMYSFLNELKEFGNKLTDVFQSNITINSIQQRIECCFGNEIYIAVIDDDRANKRNQLNTENTVTINLLDTLCDYAEKLTYEKYEPNYPEYKSICSIISIMSHGYIYRMEQRIKKNIYPNYITNRYPNLFIITKENNKSKLNLGENATTSKLLIEINSKSKIIKLDSNMDSFYNTKENFQLMNNLLLKEITKRVNFNGIIKELAVIEDEIKKNETDFI